MRRCFGVWVALALVVTAAGCQRKTTENGPVPRLAPTPRPALSSVLIERVPHVAQKPDFCGEAVVASWLGALGQKVDQDDVFDASGMDPARGMGVTTRELAQALTRLGIETGPVWYSVAAGQAEAELDQRFAELHADLARGVPSIVCTHFDERPDTTEHFRLVLGYDAKSDEVVYHEPADKNGAYRRMARSRFLTLWPLKYDSARWTVIRLSMKAGKVAVPRAHPGFRPADYAQHVMKLREKLPRGFDVVVEPPFVVTGDGGRAAVARSAEGTVRWTVRMLEQDYFDRPPSRILDVRLFQNADSYEKHNQKLFGKAPSTPYGFYSREHGALVMNIATGGGTLVHEIVHPYIESNFPGCPAWLNEGLGSLYEQSAERDGHIVGLTNWRLPGLQRAIAQHRNPSIPALVATTTDEFYDDDSGVHYAQARYLLYYLQERGLLRTFFAQARRDHASDPTGEKTLERVLGNPDMKAFQKQWEGFVLGLRFAG